MSDPHQDVRKKIQYIEDNIENNRRLIEDRRLDIETYQAEIKRFEARLKTRYKQLQEALNSECQSIN